MHRQSECAQLVGTTLAKSVHALLDDHHHDDYDDDDDESCEYDDHDKYDDHNYDDGQCTVFLIWHPYLYL